MIFGVTGSGRTAEGVLKVLNHLPVKIVSPDQLPLLVKDKENPEHGHVIYLTNIKTEDVIVSRDPDGKFNKADFYSHPEKYKVLIF
jgi:alpha-aminoadipic semialdehyde synthase